MSARTPSIAPSTLQLGKNIDEAMPSLSSQAASLWAKKAKEDETAWLSLPQHLTDAMCAADHIWQNWVAPTVKTSLVRMTGLSEDEVKKLYLWAAGTHDLGKATTTFVRLIENSAGGELLVNRIANSGLPLEKNATEQNLSRFPHALGSRVILLEWLQKQGLRPRVARSLATVADAHHGLPSQSEWRRPAQDALSDYPESWRSVQEEILEMIAALSDIRTILPTLLTRKKAFRAPELQLLTGLVIMADWIASNTDAFPLDTQGSQAERVEKAMKFIDLTGPWAASPLESEALDEYLRTSFDWPSHFSARPIQRALAAAVEQVEGPSLTVLEAPTGEGKTEAALVAAQILAARTGAQGIIFAAPTMSTANGLFDRVTLWARKNTPGQDISSMFLAHSKNRISRSFQELRLSNIGDPREGGSERSHGEVVANDWLSGRKTGVLSNFVVSTVDQVLLMVLQSRHSMLRHLGLAGKVVVIDEAHAYDAYMSSYLETALEWLARYGVSVILMSATLPLAQKTSLARAYASQLTSDPILADSTAYPLVTVVSRDGLVQQEVESRPTDIHASVELIDDSLDELHRHLSARTDEGGCVLIVCNTIRRAQETYTRLRENFPAEEVELHHAAFMASERADKEDRLREQLGPNAHRGSGRPWRLFIVATQVAEQSLDIDADLLVSDICPMDLLIQRIGRIHRHNRPDDDRPENLRQPQVLVRGTLRQEPSPEFEAGTAHIYDPALLLSTLTILQERVLQKGFRRPDDIAPLVHAAYDPDLPAPPGWEAAWLQARQESSDNRQRARRRAETFRFPSPAYAADLDLLFARFLGDVDTPQGEEAGFAQVRDSDPTIEVIPIVNTEYGYRPLGGGEEVELMDDAVPERSTAFRLASSTVRLPAKFSRHDAVFDITITQLEQETPRGWSQSHLLRGQVALRLDENQEIELSGRRLRYSSALGLAEVTP